MGSLDFQFNPGPFVSQAASLEVLNFGGDGTLAGSPSLMGDVSGGPLPCTLIFDNGSAFNDYFEDFTFGSTLSFEISLSGPAVDTPDGTATSGSTFAFSMFSDAADTIPALTTDSANDFTTTVDINLDGSAMATNLSTQTTISPRSAAPEPNTCVLIGSAIGIAEVAAMAPARFLVRML
ncbi:MAG TPA: NF038129 family PEP-CTERM protein [Bryobacteraceae bacterium]|nr:NF038129 family PEP-CTERM protein [Bryobacteraceae bacterium]